MYLECIRFYFYFLNRKVIFKVIVYLGNENEKVF